MTERRKGPSHGRRPRNDPDAKELEILRPGGKHPRGKQDREDDYRRD